MDDIQAQFRKRVTSMDAPIAEQEFRGEYSQTDFEIIRRRGMFNSSTYAKRVPTVYGQFHWYAGDLYVNVILRPPVSTFQLAKIIGTLSTLMALLLVFSLESHATGWIGAIVSLLVGGVYVASIFVGWKDEVGYAINAIGEITDGEMSQDPR